MTAVPPQNESTPVLGILAEFAAPEALKAAAVGMKAAGYVRCEAYSPYPVHGLDAALGHKRSIIPWLVFVGGALGCSTALLLQWWTNAVDYPYLISGKPLFSLPANIPVTFELIILFGALASFAGVLAYANLPEFYHPLFANERFRRSSTDAFFLTVDAADPHFDANKTSALLRTLGAVEIETFRAPSTASRIPGYLKGAVALAVALAFLPPLWVAKYRFERKSSPRIHPILDMDFQPKYLPQQYSPLFKDTRDMRPPVAGAISADARMDDAAFSTGEIDGKPVSTFPVAVTPELMQRGQERFGIYCATCHGLSGEGDGITSQLAFQREEPKWVKPMSLHEPLIVEQPVGQLFKTITEGIRTMPSYRSQIPAEDRWAILLYVRALQRSRHAAMQDVPEELQKHLIPTERTDATPSPSKP